MKTPAHFINKIFKSMISLAIMLTIIVCVLYIYLEHELPNVDTLKKIQLQVPLKIYAADGQLMGEFGEKRRIPVRYEQIPKPLVFALLATEDQRFFEHPGVDLFGIGRAVFELVKTGRKSQGGSTITMQVARNFFLSRKKTFFRKFNEILLAIKIDSELSKQKILELYLNKIYLGNRAYGVAAAAKVYYGKALNQLTLAQMAMIAGLPQAPSTQNPIANPKLALKRRNHVLERMFEEGYINKSTMQTAINEPLSASYHGIHIAVQAPFVTEMIRQLLYKHFGDSIYSKGLNVYTTINSKLQQKANTVLANTLLSYTKRHGYRGPIATISIDETTEPTSIIEALKTYTKIGKLQAVVITKVQEDQAQAMTVLGERITIPYTSMTWARKKYEKYLGPKPKSALEVVSLGDIVYVTKDKSSWQLIQPPQVEGALISLRAKDGAILALTGGFDFYHSNYNRAIQATRQPGSSFKPFIYAAALEKGFTLATLVNDAPVVIEDPSQANLWRPENDNHKFYGPTRIREGLIRSRNLVSIRLLESIGIPYTAEFLERFGFNPSELPQGLSLALGSLSITPLTLTRAYAVFANGGFLIRPYAIQTILSSSGKMLLETKPLVACSMPCPNIPIAQQAPRVISPQVAFLMNSALKDVIQHGTGRRAKVLKRSDIAGKTGTTNDQVDAWFSGFNPEMATTVWVGFDEPKSLKEYASRLALPAWIEFMRTALLNKKIHKQIMPEGMVSVRIDPKTGLRTNDLAQGIFELFRIENLPDFSEEHDANLTTSRPNPDSLF